RRRAVSDAEAAKVGTGRRVVAAVPVEARRSDVLRRREQHSAGQCETFDVGSQPRPYGGELHPWGNQPRSPGEVVLPDSDILLRDVERTSGVVDLAAFALATEIELPHGRFDLEQ